MRRHDEPTRHGSATGLGWGLATGAVAALFPAVGILGALTVGGGAGAALGAVAGHASGAVSRDDFKALGEVLDQGDAGLVVVYPPEMADRVSTSVRRRPGRCTRRRASPASSSPPTCAQPKSAPPRPAAADL